MFNNNKTLRQAIYEEEVGNFYDSYEESQKDNSNGQMLDENGNLLAVINKKNEHYNSIFKKTKIVDEDILGKHREDIAMNGKSFVDYISGSSQEIPGEYSFNDCMDYIASIHNSLKNEFYGVMLIDIETKAKFNPLHPIVAVELSKQDLSGKQYNIFIFTTENIPSKYKQDRKKIRENAQINIADQLMMYGEASPSNGSLTPSESKTDFIKNILKDENHVLRFSEGDAQRDKNNVYIIPNQLLTHGIAVPYYGTCFVYYSGSSPYGFHGTPMLTPNISRCNYNEEITSNTDTSSVCTGNVPSTTIKGLKTLTHANLSSPHFSTIIIPGWHEYALECVNTSLSILKGFINEDLQKEIGLYEEPVEPEEITSDTIWRDFEDKLDGEPNPTTTSLMDYKTFFTEHTDSDIVNDYPAKKIMTRYRKFKKRIEEQLEQLDQSI